MCFAGVQHLQGLASWLPPQAGMFMWMKLEGGVKDADDIIDALKDEQVAVVPGVPNLHLYRIDALKRSFTSTYYRSYSCCLQFPSIHA